MTTEMVVPVEALSEVSKPLTAVEIKAQVNLIQEVMKAVMNKESHYGIIPGCKQHSLYKPGAEKLLMTFRISTKSIIEDLSTIDETHYRVKCLAYSSSDKLLGEGIGECSSYEEKYKWRRAVCEEEFNETPEDRRRTKWIAYTDKQTRQIKKSQVKQIRTNKADMANTVLKMADKRAYVAVTLKVTAASDIFTQDLEDMDNPGETEMAPAKPDFPKASELKTNGNGNMTIASPPKSIQSDYELGADEEMGQPILNKEFLKGRGMVKTVSSKPLESGKMRYAIFFTDGNIVSSLRADHYQTAQQSKAAGVEVNYTYKLNGKYMNLETIEMVEF